MLMMNMILPWLLLLMLSNRCLCYCFDFCYLVNPLIYCRRRVVVAMLLLQVLGLTISQHHVIYPNRVPYQLY